MNLKLPSFLLSKELAASLKLQEQSYIVLIPKSILQKQGISLENPTFDLSFNQNKLSLGPSIKADPSTDSHQFGTDAT
ncbi:MAG: hypothetical protein FJ356_03105 [Thaumarchaeota archaeon]|nr:hypothetical protein [Nitrososphaerota archaeon]